MASVQVRYIVQDMDAAIEFYCQHLGFKEVMHPSPFFAMLSHGDLRLVLSKPNNGPGGGQAMPSGETQKPGGWNRFALQVLDLEKEVKILQEKNVSFRSHIIEGVGVKQCLIEDPSGNPVELFQPIIPEAALRR
jgi:catechol 2,3-dioxygenase-like lactoylglutathione lyase family enzyme